MTEHAHGAEEHDHDHDGEHSHVHPDDKDVNAPPVYDLPPEVIMQAYAQELADLSQINFELRTKVAFQAQIIEYLTNQLSLAEESDGPNEA